MSGVVTTQQAAQRLQVHPSRVRALIGAGALTATRAGDRWLIDADSLDRHADRIAAGATGRSFAPRTAWAAAALCDGLADRLNPTERYRLRSRLVHAGDTAGDTAAVVSRWLSRRARSMHHYRASDRDVADVLGSDGVMPTGISTAEVYGLGLGGGSAADAYVDEATRRRLEEQFVLIDSERGNLILRVLDSAVVVPRAPVAPRLIAGVDLAEDTDARTRASGAQLIDDALRALHAA